MLSPSVMFWLFVTLLTVARQVALSMGFSRQEYRSGLPFPTPGNVLEPGIESVSLKSIALADRFFTRSHLGSPLFLILPFDLFILFLAVLRLHCFACASSSCGAQVSHCGGFPGCTVWALGIWAHRLGCPEARGIFLDQGWNPCPLHWQTDSYPTVPPGKSSDDSIILIIFHF